MLCECHVGRKCWKDRKNMINVSKCHWTNPVRNEMCLIEESAVTSPNDSNLWCVYLPDHITTLQRLIDDTWTNLTIKPVTNTPDHLTQTSSFSLITCKKETDMINSQIMGWFQVLWRHLLFVMKTLSKVLLMSDLLSYLIHYKKNTFTLIIMMTYNLNHKYT